jgi:hypothetical protein
MPPLAYFLGKVAKRHDGDDSNALARRQQLFWGTRSLHPIEKRSLASLAVKKVFLVFDRLQTVTF